MQACARKYKEIVELLLENGAEVNAQNIIGCTAAHYCVEEMDENNKEDVFDIISYLFKSGANFNLEHKYLGTSMSFIKRKSNELYDFLKSLIMITEEKEPAKVIQNPLLNMKSIKEMN